MIMAFDFSCPMCKHIMQVDNSAVGEMGVCPKCEAEVSIQRNSASSESEESQNVQDEQPLATDSPKEIVELSTGTTIATRIVVILVFLCVMGCGGLAIIKGFEMFGYKYDGIEKILEDKPENGLSDYQKNLIKQTNENQGPPDYSEFSVDQPDRTEEELRIDASLGASGGNGGGFGGAPTGGDSVDGGEDGGRRNFDPESIFAERDKDKDGFLSGDEISERMRTRMAAIDEDKDGAISKDEFLAAMRRSRSSRQGGGGDAPLGDENE
jgi:hypothetical protein